MASVSNPSEFNIQFRLASYKKRKFTIVTIENRFGKSVQGEFDLRQKKVIALLFNKILIRNFDLFCMQIDGSYLQRTEVFTPSEFVLFSKECCSSLIHTMKTDELDQLEPFLYREKVSLSDADQRWMGERIAPRLLSRGLAAALDPKSETSPLKQLIHHPLFEPRIFRLVMQFLK